MRTIEVTTASAKYQVHVGAGLLPTLAGRIAEVAGENRRLFMLTSPEIWALWSEKFLVSFAEKHQPLILFLPAGEQHKRLSQLERLAQELAEAGADRSSLLIAFGGGVVGDVAGFLAAIYMRGIEYVQVPSTLLAQVDSSVGGKTGVNLDAGKNLVGSFHSPIAVFADIDLLSTLPPRELRAGLYESLKMGIIRDAELFQEMEENAAELLAGDPHLLESVVARSVALKAEVVGLDERENGLRMILNLGHTVGHAIEAVTKYKSLLHGEAVAWGMLAAVHIAKARGVISPDDAGRMEKAILRFGALPGFRASADALAAATAGDKKNRAGTRRYVLPQGIGNAVVVEDLTDLELHAGIEAMLAARGS